MLGDSLCRHGVYANLVCSHCAGFAYGEPVRAAAEGYRHGACTVGVVFDTEIYFFADRHDSVLDEKFDRFQLRFYCEVIRNALSAGKRYKKSVRARAACGIARFKGLAVEITASDIVFDHRAVDIDASVLHARNVGLLCNGNTVGESADGYYRAAE